MRGQGFGSLPRVEGAVFGVLCEVAGAFIPAGVHQLVQHLGSPFQVGQAFVQRGVCVVLGVIQQGDDVMHVDRTERRRRTRHVRDGTGRGRRWGAIPHPCQSLCDSRGPILGLPSLFADGDCAFLCNTSAFRGSMGSPPGSIREVTFHPRSVFLEAATVHDGRKDAVPKMVVSGTASSPLWRCSGGLARRRA